MASVELSKRAQVLTSFKQRLRSGKWRNGSRLPTRTQLIKTFKVSPVTLQLVIDDLMQEGFVQSRGREGTFAAASPPFARNFGFVLGGLSEERHNWVHYWRVLEAEATKAFSGTEKQALYYYGIEKPLSVEIERLRQDIEAQRLAGVFFSNMPNFLMNSALLTQKHTPLVAVGSSRAKNLSIIKLGTDRFFDSALRAISAAGRRRVGLITPWEDPREHLAEFTALAGQFGLQTHPRWCQYAPHSIGGRRWAANAAQAIASGVERPDALVIYDDNLIESTMAGMQAAGCAVPCDCLVVAHSNFPWPIASPYPLIRIGVNITEVVKSAVAEIDRRQGGAPPCEIHIPLQTQSEVPDSQGITEKA
jgi:DNA-binding LacI/PurR family transcriptional regulator